MDAIRMLKDDHKTVSQLFKRFERAGDQAHTEKREIVDRIIEELSLHAAVEEQLFYPVVRATVPKTEDIALESLEEHHIVKWLLSELDTMAPEDERFDAKVTVLIENVRHHVEEEEEELFPMVRDELGRNALGDLGDALASAKKTAPTHPHPRSPDAPPGNLVAGAAAGVADRIGDTVSGLAQGGVTAVGDIIAIVLRRKKPRVSPTGSKLARSTARQVRSGAADATEAAVKATRKVKRTGKRAAKRPASRPARKTGAVKASAKRTTKTAKRGAASTVRAARSGAKSTATSARKSTKRTAATAKRSAKTTARTARKTTKRTAATAKRSAKPTARSARKTTKRTAATAKRPARKATSARR